MYMVIVIRFLRIQFNRLSLSMHTHNTCTHTTHAHTHTCTHTRAHTHTHAHTNTHTQVLLVWDDGEVRKILRTADWVLDRLGLVQGAKSMRGLVVCFRVRTISNRLGHGLIWS